jgi:alginate biosynthesis protein AlgX
MNFHYVTRVHNESSIALQNRDHMKFQKSLAFFSALLLFTTAAQGQESAGLVSAPSSMDLQQSCNVEDITPIFCSALGNEEMYSQNSYGSYKLLIPGKNGWIFRTQSDFKSNFALSRQTLNNFDEFNQALKKKNIELVILMTPTRGLMHSEFIPQEQIKSQNFNVNAAWENYWDSIETLRDRGLHVAGVERIAPGTSFFYKRDHHWNPDGAQKSAKVLADYIKKLPVYRDIEKIQYATSENGTHDFFGVSKKVFKKLCNTKQPPERIIKKTTERVNAAAGQDDLFGDTKEPQIVLIGTSNSTMEPSFANFEGFLKEELSADILNMSVSGGGVDTAMISYLNSDSFRDTPAKIAIWEIPAYYELSTQNNFFREIVAAANGSCDGKAIAELKDTPIDEASMTALDKLADKKITGDDYYARVNFSRPMSKPFHFDLRYMKNRDKYKFQRAARYPHDGQFFLTLRNDKKEYLDKVVLMFPPEAIGNSISMQICKKENSSASQALLELNNSQPVNEMFGKLKQSVNYKETE